MEHAEAIEKRMAEQYALGELLDTDRDAFEQHFFDCPDCATDVRDAVTMMDSGRAVMREPKVVISSRRTSWWAAMATAASLAGFAMVGYQRAVVIPQVAENAQNEARKGGVIQRETVELSAVRDSMSEQPTGLKANQPFVLTLSIPPESGPGPVRAVIRTGGRIVQSYPITAEEARKFVSVEFHALPAGHYDLIIESIPTQGEPVATHSLEVR
jgi:hypothetical protein